MKKLMIALASVASLAFVAKGDVADFETDGSTGTSFEGLTVGDALDTSKDDDNTGDGDEFWSWAGENAVLSGSTVFALGQGDNPAAYAGACGRPGEGENVKALNLDTEGGRLYRCINPAVGNVHAAVGVSNATDMVLFDSVVQFTASSDDPTPESEDKLIVWLKGTEEENGVPGSTNLMVTAGHLAGASVTASNYVVTVANTTVNADEWHRLTIKALPAGSSLGFVVFVDGNLVTCADDDDKGLGTIEGKANYWKNLDALFPSLRAGSYNDAQTLTSVGFAGTGKLDDIYFKNTAPDFALEPATATITWGEGVTGVTYQFGEGAAVAATSGTAIPMSGSSITFNVTYDTDNGWSGSIAYLDATPVSGTTYTVAQGVAATFTINAVQNAYSVDGTPYSTLAGAISAAGNGGTVALRGNVTTPVELTGTPNFVLDLAGKSISVTSDEKAAINSVGTLKIIDSVGNGTIENNGTGGALWIESGAVTIGDTTGDEGATFVGGVELNGEDSTITLSVVRGTFEDDDEGVVAGNIAEGSTGTIDGDNYVVAPSAPAPTPSYIVIAENRWYDSPVAVVLAENLPGQTGNIVSAFHGQGEGEYLGLTYSTNPLQFDLFTVDGTDEPTTVTSVDAEDLTTPGLRGVAISKTLGIAMTLRYATTTTMYAYPLAGGEPTAVTLDTAVAFDAAAFSPDGKYLFSNAVAGDGGQSYYVKWAVSNGGATLTRVGSIDAGGRARSLAYARINGRDLVFGLVDTGKVAVIDMTGDDTPAWTAADLVTGLPAHSYGTLCVSGVNATNALGQVVAPHLTVATSTNNGATKVDVLNVYALTVPATGAVSASLTKSFDEDALTAAGFGDISDANRYGNTVYVTDDEKTIYFARPDNKLYAAQFGEARIGNDIYLTLKDAVDAADTGDTVTVAKNCSVTNGNTGITFTKGINLVNNYTITIDGANYALRIANGTTTPVTMSGTGSLVWAKGSGSPILVGCNELKSGYGINSFYEGSFVLNGGSLTSTDATAKGGNLVKLEAGTFVLNSGTINGGTRGVKADSEGNNATCVLTINGGTIVNTNSAAIAASTAGSGSSTVTVNGGTFTGAITGAGMVTIPATSTAQFDRDQTSFCVTGYKTVLDSGWYVVTVIPLEPVDGKTNLVITADSLVAATNAVVMAVPSGSNADASEYKDLFNIVATDNHNGTFSVEIVGLKEEVEENVVEAALDVLNEEAETVTVPAGLYYRITPATSLPIPSPSTAGALSTGSAINLSKPGSDKGFYKVELSAMPIPAE